MTPEEAPKIGPGLKTSPVEAEPFPSTEQNPYRAADCPSRIAGRSPNLRRPLRRLWHEPVRRVSRSREGLPQSGGRGGRRVRAGAPSRRSPACTCAYFGRTVPWRLRVSRFRGVVSATMIYDTLPEPRCLSQRRRRHAYSVSRLEMGEDDRRASVKGAGVATCPRAGAG